MLLTKKIKLSPTKKQETLFWQSAGIGRWAYNYALGRRQEHFAKTGKTLNEGDIRKEITQLKKKEEFEWLKDVSNDIPKQAVKDLHNGYLQFFKIKKKNPDADINLPTFKKKSKTTPSFFNDTLKLQTDGINKKVRLSKVGWVKTTEILDDVKYFNPRVKYDGRYWYLTVSYEVEKKEVELTDGILGIDVGIKELAIVSNGKFYENINKTKQVKRLRKKLKRKQKRVSRKYTKNKVGKKFVKTKNILKEEKSIRLLHRKIANINNNHRHQVTSEIVKTKVSKLMIEDLNISGMMKNRHLARAIQEQGLYDFFLKLQYKAELFGIKVEKVPRFFPSSKTCSCCGNIKRDLKLSDRTYICDRCGLELDRDLNASYNIRDFKYA